MGRRAGLWLAPFIAMPGSQLATERPEFLSAGPARRSGRGRGQLGRSVLGAGCHPGRHPRAPVRDALRSGRGRDTISSNSTSSTPPPCPASTPTHGHGLMSIAMPVHASARLSATTPTCWRAARRSSSRSASSTASGWVPTSDLSGTTEATLRRGVPWSPRSIACGCARRSMSDPDVVYFRKTDLSPGTARYLQDMARIAGFKGTSDAPQSLADDEREATVVLFLQIRSRASSGPAIDGWLAKPKLISSRSCRPASGSRSWEEAG